MGKQQNNGDEDKESDEELDDFAKQLGADDAQDLRDKFDDDK